MLGMAGKKNELGATGATVAANVKRLREEQNLTYAELSRRLEATGRPVPVLGLSRVENGTRRVDVDDLMALAVALGVSPATLLMPNAATDSAQVEATALAEPVAAKALWGWMRAEDRPGSSNSGDFLLAASPEWIRRELRQFLAEVFPRNQTGRAQADGDD